MHGHLNVKKKFPVDVGDTENLVVIVLKIYVQVGWKLYLHNQRNVAAILTLTEET